MDCLGGSIFHGWRIQALYECDIPTRKLPRRRLCKSFEFMRHMTLVCVTHFGGDISHLHCLVLDGVYRTNANGQPEFIEIPAPSDEDIWEVLQRRIKRVMKQLVRRGILVEDQGETYLADDVADSKEARVLRPLQKGSCVYRIAFGPRAGQKVLTLRGRCPERQEASSGYVPTCKALACMRRYAVVPGRERPWSGFVATSPGQRLQMTECRSMGQALLS